MLFALFFIFFKRPFTLTLLGFGWIWSASVTRLCDAELKTFQETRQNMFLCWKRCEYFNTWFTQHAKFAKRIPSEGVIKALLRNKLDSRTHKMKLAHSKKWDVFFECFFLSMWADGLRLEIWTCKEIYRPIWIICSRLLDAMLSQRNFTLFGKLSH